MTHLKISIAKNPSQANEKQYEADILDILCVIFYSCEEKKKFEFGGQC